jgi:hypothetical protein
LRFSQSVFLWINHLDKGAGWLRQIDAVKRRLPQAGASIPYCETSPFHMNPNHLFLRKSWLSLIQAIEGLLKHYKAI